MTWAGSKTKLLNSVFATFGEDAIYTGPSEDPIECRVIIRLAGEFFPGEFQSQVMEDQIRIKIRKSELGDLKPKRNGVFVVGTDTYTVDGPSGLANSGLCAVAPIKLS